MIFSKSRENCIKFAEMNKSTYILLNDTMNFDRAINVDINEFYCKKYIKNKQVRRN